MLLFSSMTPCVQNYDFNICRQLFKFLFLPPSRQDAKFFYDFLCAFVSLQLFIYDYHWSDCHLIQLNCCTVIIVVTCGHRLERLKFLLLPDFIYTCRQLGMGELLIVWQNLLLWGLHLYGPQFSGGWM